MASKRLKLLLLDIPRRKKCSGGASSFLLVCDVHVVHIYLILYFRLISRLFCKLACLVFFSDHSVVFFRPLPFFLIHSHFFDAFPFFPMSNPLKLVLLTAFSTVKELKNSMRKSS